MGEPGGLPSMGSRVATREESGVLGFPSRRGLTPRGSLECNPEIPAFPGEDRALALAAALAEAAGAEYPRHSNIPSLCQNLP